MQAFQRKLILLMSFLQMGTLGITTINADNLSSFLVKKSGVII